MIKPLLSTVLATLLSATVFAQDLSFSRCFGDNMVLQRGMAVPVWGSAGPGDKVLVAFQQQRLSATADAQGRWQVQLAALEAIATPQTLEVSRATGAPVVVKNVVVGDVLLLAGQSNMGWTVAQSQGGPEFAATATWPWLRYLPVPRATVDTAASNLSPETTGWHVSDPNKVRWMSAIGVWTAEHLHAAHGVPIGLIQTAVGGTYTESWLPSAWFRDVPDLKVLRERWQKDLAEYPTRHAAWQVRKTEFDAQVASAKAAGRQPPIADDDLLNGPMGPTHCRRPSALFNGVIAPVAPFSIKAVVWYQGEGNTSATLASVHEASLKAILAGWRNAWKRDDLPFVIIQLPGREVPRTVDGWARVRAAQAKVVMEDRQAALVATLDEPGKEIHPIDKRPVAERVARALRRLVDGDDIAGTPLVVEYRQDGKHVILRFQDTGNGLRFADSAVSGFEVAGANGEFRPANATLKGNDSIVVACDGLTTPICLRYAWAGTTSASLRNSEGIPAAAFAVTIERP